MRRVAVLMLLSPLLALAQRGVGELRLLVLDSSGLPIRAAGELFSDTKQVRIVFETSPTGRYTARPLPFGAYRLRIGSKGFAPLADKFVIDSELPLVREVVLRVASVETAVVVSDSPDLLNPAEPRNHLGSPAVATRRSSPVGRSVLELIATQPGWLLEANGVLHPRGSEYETQYVVDGLPILDNRSPAYAPALEADQVQALTVMTAGYPAEYGRKLGGVIEVLTTRPVTDGFHGQALWQAGSFGIQAGSVSGGWSRGRLYVSLLGSAARTDRYLDPPSLDNFTNRGSWASTGGRLEYDLSPRDRVRAQMWSRHTGFLVPNDEEQQEAGQRQDRRNREAGGQLSWTRVFSPALMLAARGSLRDLDARLWSNSLSTPLLADQDRGFREGYASIAITAHTRLHEWKVGTDVLTSSVREDFSYRVTKPAFFEGDVPERFVFSGRKRSHEHAVYVQDEIRVGKLGVSAGLRWDAYRFLVREQAFSPRFGIAWHEPRAGLVLRASYDRVFQTPAIENLLLASSVDAQSLTADTTGLPVPPSRANFFEAGFSKTLFGRMRLDASWYRRSIRNFADDDVFLNSGVSFPVAFSGAHVQGVEARLELPRWGRLSGLLSYSNLRGTSDLPLTGGLFLEGGAELLSARGRLPITQDQRNTAYGRLQYRVHPRVWLALAGWYGSGLPFEREGDQVEVTDGRILNRVNLERGRVRPSFSLDAHAGITLLQREQRSLALQVDASNLNDRLNVVNFSGVFSGTAIAMPRSFAVRLQSHF